MFSDILLTADFDRTLTAPDSTVPQRNMEAIRYFMDNGGAFTVNTGRSVPMARALSKLVPANAPLLLYNGSAAYDVQADQLTFFHPIDLPMQQTMMDMMAQFPDLIAEVQGVDAHYRFSRDPMWEAFCDHNGCAWGIAQPDQDLGPFVKFSLYGQLRDVTVAGLYSGSDEERRRMDEVEQLLKTQLGDKVEVFRAAMRIIDVHAKGVSKAKAARQLQQQLGRKILVCVGDAENDIPMLEDADFAYCPADGTVAERFENVCNCADGAVADVIYKKIPEITGIKA